MAKRYEKFYLVLKLKGNIENQIKSVYINKKTNLPATII